MFPGRVSRLSVSFQASGATIDGNADIVMLTGTTQVTTIKPRQSGVGGQMVWLIPTDGNVAVATGGNIAAAETCPQDKATALIYEPTTALWYPLSAA